MEYRNIRVGQKLLLRGQLHEAYEAEVVQVDPRRITHAGYRQPVVGDPVQVKVVLCPGEAPSLLWVNPDRLMDSDRRAVQSSSRKGYTKTMKTTKSTKSIALTSAEIVTLLASLKATQMTIQGLEEYKEFNGKLRDLETTVRQQS